MFAANVLRVRVSLPRPRKSSYSDVRNISWRGQRAEYFSIGSNLRRDAAAIEILKTTRRQSISAVIPDLRKPCGARCHVHSFVSSGSPGSVLVASPEENRRQCALSVVGDGIYTQPGRAALAAAAVHPEQLCPQTRSGVQVIRQLKLNGTVVRRRLSSSATPEDEPNEPTDNTTDTEATSKRAPTKKPKKRKRAFAKARSADVTQVAVAGDGLSDGIERDTTDPNGPSTASATDDSSSISTDGTDDAAMPTKSTPKKAYKRKRRAFHKPRVADTTQGEVVDGADVPDGDKGHTGTKASDDTKSRVEGDSIGPADTAGGGGAASDTSSVKVPKKKRRAFARARAEGVIQRVVYGGGVPRSNEKNPRQDEEHSRVEDATPRWEAGDDDASRTSRRKGLGDLQVIENAVVGDPPSKTTNRKKTNAKGSAGSSDDENKSSWTREKYEPPGRSVLGHLLVDLKYKRLYVTCVEELLKVPVWQKSKSLRPVHAMEIANAKLAKTRVVDGIPGVITVVKRPLLPLRKKNQSYTLGIVDGQHRLGALALLADKGQWDKTEANIVIEIFDVKDDSDIQDLSMEINRAEPTRVVDVPEGGPRQIEQCAMKVVLHLHQEFSEMFGGQRCRPPHVHAETFKDNLLQSGLIERHKLYDPQELLDFLLRVNEMLSRRDIKAWSELIKEGEGQFTNKSLTSALDRAKRFKFWLGLEKSWMLT